MPQINQTYYNVKHIDTQNDILILSPELDNAGNKHMSCFPI